MSFLSKIWRTLIPVVLLAFAVTPVLASEHVSLQWYGQAAFKVTTPGGKVIVIDPFITKNPKTPAELKDLGKLGKVDLILVTHGHGDHIGGLARLLELTGATAARMAVATWNISSSSKVAARPIACGNTVAFPARATPCNASFHQL